MPQRLRLHGRRLITATLVMTALAAMTIAVTSPATADPAPPATVSEAVHQLSQLNQKAEVLTEAWHTAQDQLAGRQADLRKARATEAAARTVAVAARAQQEQFRGQVDELTSASYQGVQLNQLSALLASPSPRDYLDQVSALDMVAVDSSQTLRRYTAVATLADSSAHTASDATAEAQRMAEDADRAAREAQARKQEADRQIAVVQQQLAKLSGEARKAYNGPGQTDFPIDVVGTGVGAAALRAALTQQGKPYAWGATGPNSFDCSGLVVWAFKQVGVTLPRSSSEMASVGMPVSGDALQPGDLVLFYHPIHHVAIYVGAGKVLHAPQSGDVVKVASMSGMPFTTARRI